MFLKSRIIDNKKKAAEYHIKCSAVKKIQKAKRGIDKTRQIIPAPVDHLLFLFRINIAKIIKKITS